MGLDQYLTGKKDFWDFDDTLPKEDGFKVSKHTLELGYWRKDPNLHGFIVNTFAKGEDDCKPIWLSVEDINIIIKAVEADELPYTEGFFFGRSANINSDNPEEVEWAQQQKAYTLKIFRGAIEWLNKWEGDKIVHASVHYAASW